MENKEFKDKRKLFQEHINSKFWIENNLYLYSGLLRTVQDPTYSDYRIIKELNFMIHNRSSIDLWEMDLTLQIFGSYDYLFLEKKVICWKIIPAKSRVKIIEYFFSEEDNLIPSSFTWKFRIDSVKVSGSYIDSQSL